MQTKRYMIFIIIILTGILMVLFLAGCNEVSAQTREKEVSMSTESETDESTTTEETENIITGDKIIWDGNIDQDFDDEKILITINKAYTSTQFTMEDFSSIGNISEVHWITKLNLYEETQSWPDSFTQIYSLKISNKGKQNVIDTIRLLEKLNFVHSASPNYFGHYN